MYICTLHKLYIQTKCTIKKNGIPINFALKCPVLFQQDAHHFPLAPDTFFFKMKVLQQVTQLFLSCAGALWLFTNKVPTRRGQGSKAKLDTEQEGKEGKNVKEKMQTKSSLELPRGASATCSTWENFPSGPPLHQTQESWFPRACREKGAVASLGRCPQILWTDPPRCPWNTRQEWVWGENKGHANKG